MESKKREEFKKIYTNVIDLLMKGVIENYPALDERKVMVALFHCMKKHKFKQFVKTSFVLDSL